MKYIVTLQIAIILVSASSWCVNAYKFFKSDFDPSWKREVIHGVGIFVPPIAIITAWLNVEE